MRVLLDENLPHRLRHLRPGHDVVSVEYLGWKATRNGALLARAASGGFAVLVTKDQGIAYEQNLTTLPVAVVILQAKSNKLADIRPLVPQLLTALPTLTPRTVVHVP